MTISCPLSCLCITDLHHCVPDAGPLSVPWTLFPCFLLQRHHTICSICPQPRGSGLLLCFSVENGMPLPGEPLLYSSLPPVLFPLHIYPFLLYIGHCFVCFVLFLPTDKSVSDLSFHAALWRRTGPLPRNESVRVCWLTQEDYIINSNFVFNHMRRTSPALSSIHVTVQKPPWCASNSFQNVNYIHPMKSDTLSSFVCMFVYGSTVTSDLCVSPWEQLLMPHTCTHLPKAFPVADFYGDESKPFLHSVPQICNSSPRLRFLLSASCKHSGHVVALLA